MHLLIIITSKGFSQALTRRLENGKVELAIGVLTNVRHLGTGDNNANATFEDHSGNLCNFHVSRD